MTTEELLELTDRVKGLVTAADEQASPDGLDLHEVSRAVLAGLERADLNTLAAWWLADEVRSERRARTYAAERAAERFAEAAERTRKASLRLTKPWEAGVSPRKFTAKQYDAWVEGTDEGKRYEEEQQRREAEEREHRARFHAELQSIQERYAAELRIEWTEELLASGFALPDGSVVTWGAASVVQHRQRAAMFEANAEGNLRGAARHRRAVEVLESAGVPCLSVLVSTGAGS